MSDLAARFARVTFWCWLSVFGAIIVTTIALALADGIADLSSGNTWAVFAMAVFFFALWALPVALLLAVFISAALFVRYARSSGHAQRVRF